VNQKDVMILDTINTAENSLQAKIDSESKIPSNPQISNIGGNMLPDSKFSNYSHAGKTFLLRKTAEGYSLYEESIEAADGLLLKGKIIVMDKMVKFMDTSGKVSDAVFDTSGYLTVSDGSSSTIYKSVN
jgi:hypothetical protein